jgi:altronate hydrolase
LQLHAEDNVAVARMPIAAGERVAADGTAAREAVPAGHKVAVRAIQTGEPVTKYGQVIGFATAPIAPGEHVHTQNLTFAEFDRASDGSQAALQRDRPEMPASFMGFRRTDGRVGTRNYLGVIASVNCSATVVRQIVKAMGSRIEDEASIDGIVAINHGGGCGVDAAGEGLVTLRRTIAGYAAHANFAGVLLIGLGCEGNQIADLIAREGLDPGDMLRTATIQDMGGTRAAIDWGCGVLEEMIPGARAERVSVPASELRLGLQCGGSDGYSGITANPALGVAADILVSHGGTAILSETPEIYGAEHLLAQRAVSPEVVEKLKARIEWWEDYTRRNHQSMDNNPSPGNKAGGLTTILEKSLGAVAKGGTSPLIDVYRYAERIDKHGFVFMDSPGYDPVSATGQVAAGANLIAFTTGRGSAFGAKPAPSIKLATNSAIYRRMQDDMDIDCGTILDGSETIEEKGRQIFDLLLRTASGEPSKSEALGYGDEEFAPWIIGATM